MRPNITESLFTMPKDVGDRINELIPETKEHKQYQLLRNMPRSNIVVPFGNYKGQLLHDAFLGILNNEQGPHYDIASWTDRVGLSRTGAKQFARKLRKWYHKYYLPKIGGKRKKKKTRKKKR